MHEIIIEPGRTEANYWRDLWRFRELLSVEVPVIAENIGENPRLIQNSINGLLASTADEWQEKLDCVITNTAERHSIAGRELETIRSKFSAPVVFRQLTAAFDMILAA